MAAIIFNVLPLIPYLSVFISFSFLWVGRQGFSLLRRRPLRRFRALRAALANAHAFTQLRALSGSNPCRGNKKATNRSRSLSFLWWAVRGSACSAGGRCGASRLARCAGKRSRVYSAPRPDGFEPVTRQQKSGRHPPVAFLFYGGPSGVRTLDLGIKSPLLCQLS